MAVMGHRFDLSVRQFVDYMNALTRPVFEVSTVGLKCLPFILDLQKCWDSDTGHCRVD